MTHEQDDTVLDALFAQASDAAPSPDLMARVMADAMAVQDAAAAPVPPSAPSGGWLTGLLSGLGGWSAISGITAAGVMGLSVGLYAPDTFAGLWQGDSLTLGVDSYGLAPDMSDFWTEDGDV